MSDLTGALGGYTVQPVPAPASTIDDARSSRKEGGRSQKLILFTDEKLFGARPDFCLWLNFSSCFSWMSPTLWV